MNAPEVSERNRKKKKTFERRRPLSPLDFPIPIPNSNRRE